MKHYILYFHGGSSNHGCEALVRTTCDLLDYTKSKIDLASFRPEIDKLYGIDKLCRVHKMYEQKPVRMFTPKWIKAYIDYKTNCNIHALDDIQFLNLLNAKKGHIAIQIGGDNYCYNGVTQLINANDIWRRNGIKTVLWGCSVEPELLENPIIADDISKFDLITARESISYEALKKVNKNTVLVSDSAFLLDSEIKPMPDGFESSDIIGLNLSPLAEECEKVKGITKKNYEKLIEYVFNNTEMKILLIPHVIIDGNDDREINKYLFDKYKDTNRIQTIEDCNCKELKGYISRCKFFVGARTHATIAAYSTGVPTLVLGYSVKSKGIARDLFGDDSNYVLPVQNLSNENDLLNAFLWIKDNKVQIKNHLKEILPEYKMHVYNGVNAIKKLK